MRNQAILFLLAAAASAAALGWGLFHGEWSNVLLNGALL